MKNFSFNSEDPYILYCFDKKSGKCYHSNINKIGGEKRFYDTNEDYNQSVENTLSKIESKLSYSYRKLLKKQDLKFLKKSDKTALSYLLLIQWFRTRETREKLRDYNRQYHEFLSKYGELSEELEKKFDINDDYTKEIHIPLLKEIPSIVPYVLNMKWTLTINKTDMPFWSSDNPITFDNFLNQSKFNSYGLYSEGINIHFPLSPNIMLSFSDPFKFYFLPDKIKSENEDNIIYHNALQVKNSYRTLFSNKNSFNLAKQILQDNSKLKDPNRKRWNIEPLTDNN